MPIMYDRELRLLGSTGAITAAKAIKHTGTDDNRLTFELHLLIKGNTEWATLVNSHNKTRLFPNLNFLFTLVSDNCPAVKAVEITLPDRPKR